MHVLIRGRLYARRIARTVASFSFLVGLGSAGASAQQASAPAQLSLDEAIALARRNNPDFQAQKNDAIVADWAVREAYGVAASREAVGTDYGFNHSSFTYLIDRAGNLRALMPYGHPPDDYVHDVRILLEP